MRTRLILAGLVAALTLAGAAGGYLAGRIVTIRSGDRAKSLPSLWLCANHGASIECFSGDAFPYVDLTATQCRNGRYVAWELPSEFTRFATRKADA